MRPNLERNSLCRRAGELGFLLALWLAFPTAALPAGIELSESENDTRRDVITEYGVKNGRLASFLGARNSIPPTILAELIKRYVPDQAPKLLIFAQCFGGDTAADSFVGSLPRVTILSATSPGQEAHYGGYHDDAARALKPGPGRSAQDVHDAGNQGRHVLEPGEDGRPPTAEEHQMATEFPVTKGDLKAFSLESTSATGAVRSRHVVVYVGDPDTKSQKVKDQNGLTVPTGKGESRDFSDTADRDAIKKNFAGQPNTTVTTVGGPIAPNSNKGQDGWDNPGTVGGLMRAIQKAGQAIKNAPQPDQEQFILFVGDHGAQGAFPDEKPKKLASGTSSLVRTAPALVADAPAVHYMGEDPDNVPGFSLLLEYGDQPLPLERQSNGEFAPLFEPGYFTLELQPTEGEALTLEHFEETVYDLDDDGFLGSVVGEGVDLWFPVDEALFLERLTDTVLEVYLANNTPTDVTVVGLDQLSGAIARAGDPPVGAVSTAVSEPGAAVLPPTFALAQNYPNPFNRTTVIRFALSQDDMVILTVYNLAGQQVATLAQGVQKFGTYTVRWDGWDDDGRELASGVYLYRLRTGDGKQVETRKLVLVR